MPLTRCFTWVVGAGMMMCLGAPASAGAQDPGGDLDPTVGLALSGGAAKGFAHVGVLLALKRAGVRVDVVSGTSMGSIVGALYAMGMSADSIEGRIQGVDWGNVVSDGSERERRFLHQRRFDERAIATLPIEGGIVGLPAGAIVGSNMVRLLEQATWPAATIRDFSQLPRPFAAVATDIESGQAVTLTGGVLSEVLRASAGIPGAFDPMELHGSLLVDGAIARNLPATDARDLGADFVICSDVSDPLGSADDLTTLLDIIDQVMTLAMRRATIEQREYCDILVRPDVLGLSGFAFDRASDWIARGEAAAERHELAFRELAASQRDRPPAGSPTFIGDSIRVARIDVEGSVREQTVELVRKELRLVEDAYVTPERLASELSDLDATGLFGLVRYRLDAEPQGVALTVNVQERPKDRLGIGLRYDDEHRAALLFTTTVHNMVRYGSVVRLDLRIGEETKVGASYIRRHGITGRSEGSTTISWSQGELLVPSTGLFSEIELTTASTSLGLVGGRSTFIGIGLTGEWAVLGTASDVALLSVVGLLDHESLDRIDFPRSGIDASARWEWGVSDRVSGESFSVATTAGKVYLPLLSRLTVDVGFELGLGRGADLPLHRTFFLGGAHSSVVFPYSHPLFHGLVPSSSNGRAMSVGRAGLRWEPRQNTFVRVGVDVGQTADEWRFPVDDAIVGVGVGLGVDTIVGPLWVEWSKADDGSESRLSIGVGRVF